MTKGYSSVQVKVRNGECSSFWCLEGYDGRYEAFGAIAMDAKVLTCELATSNDPWGPTGTDMADIAAMTFNRYGAW